MRFASILALSVLFVPLLSFANDGSAAAKAEIQEWEVPWADTRPRDPYLAPDGKVWFVGQVGDYLAYLDPASGEFKQFNLDPGTGPHNLIVDSENIVWYAGNRAAHIGKLAPTTGEITKYPMPEPAARDPHTLTFDDGGDIWFTVQQGNFVGHFDTETGKSRLIAVPTQGARPYGIVIAPDKTPWIVEFGSNKLARIDPAKFELEEIALPREDARPRRLAITSDGAIWYGDYAQGKIGRYVPKSGEFKEWDPPAGDDSRPYAVMTDNQDRIWFAETQRGDRKARWVGFDPKTEKFFSMTDVESGGGSVRHAYYDAAKQEIWFGTDTNTIGVLRLP